MLQSSFLVKKSGLYVNMLRFVVDEDMPRSTSRILRDRGFEVLDVRDCGLRGAKDVDIFKFAQREDAVILTGDVGFGNLLSYVFIIVLAALGE